MSSQGQDCRHEFPVDAVCNHCEVMLSDYVRRLKARASQLEHLVIAANNQTRKLEEHADRFHEIARSGHALRCTCGEAGQISGVPVPDTRCLEIWERCGK